MNSKLFFLAIVGINFLSSVNSTESPPAARQQWQTTAASKASPPRTNHLGGKHTPTAESKNEAPPKTWHPTNAPNVPVYRAHNQSKPVESPGPEELSASSPLFQSEGTEKKPKGAKWLQSKIAKTGSNCTQLMGSITGSMGKIFFKSGAKIALDIAANTVLVSLGETLAAVATGGATAGVGLAVGAARVAQSAIEATSQIAETLKIEVPKVCRSIALMEQEKCCENKKNANLQKVCARAHSLPRDFCKLGNCMIKAVSAAASPSLERYKVLKEQECCGALQKSPNLPKTIKKKFFEYCERASKGFDDAENIFKQNAHRIGKDTGHGNNSADDSHLSVGNANYKCQCTKIN